MHFIHVSPIQFTSAHRNFFILGATEIFIEVKSYKKAPHEWAKGWNGLVLSKSAS